jgi:tRNA pseudouridine13 synthase
MLRLAKGQRAKGKAKSKPEDFRVEEITQSGFTLEIGKTYSAQDIGLKEEEGKFSVFIMQKNNWNTSQALKTIARKFRRGVKSTGFAGTKDRTSISTQLCSIFGVKAEELSRIHIKDITINGAWSANSKIEMGGLLGNRFGITIREPSDYDNIQSIISELNGVFPNYYGEQRFGNRNTNVEVGVDILKGDFKNAALRFLTETQNETNEDAKVARQKLAEELDFKAALQYFPAYLKYELGMIEYLAQYPDNYANAIRKLPRSISLMFIHSVEAHIFNKELEERITQQRLKPEEHDILCQKNSYGFPDITKLIDTKENNSDAFILGNILGYDTTSATDSEQKILEELGLTLESFKVKGLNELNSKGTYRVLFAPYKDMSHSYEKEQGTFELGFSLPSGSYATVLLDEILE